MAAVWVLARNEVHRHLVVAGLVWGRVTNGIHVAPGRRAARMEPAAALRTE